MRGSEPLMPEACSSANGTILGYDPGGDGTHGVAALEIQAGIPRAVKTGTLETAEAVIRFFTVQSDVLAIGLDTLTCWSTGNAGWRPADRWLRSQYPEVRNSVVSPNGLFGSMGLNGPAVLQEVRKSFPSLVVTETHPKVLYWVMAQERYGYLQHQAKMEALLSREMEILLKTESEHAWDAAISALAALRGYSGQWRNDLHCLPTEKSERLVWPCGETHYFWPE